jgi:hypothetical protein
MTNNAVSLFRRLMPRWARIEARESKRPTPLSSELGHELPSPACSQVVSFPLHSRSEGREQREVPVGVRALGPQAA